MQKVYRVHFAKHHHYSKNCLERKQTETTATGAYARIFREAAPPCNCSDAVRFGKLLAVVPATTGCPAV